MMAKLGADMEMLPFGQKSGERSPKILTIWQTGVVQD